MVNPANCVDMDCDGLKKVLITDRDGSILDGPGTMTSVSEYAWNDRSREGRSRGTGDFRYNN